MASDIAWCKNLADHLNEAGTWEIPRTGQIFQIFHSKKELHLIKGDIKDKWLFERTCLCFNAIGYKVLEARFNGERSEIRFEDRGKGKSL